MPCLILGVRHTWEVPLCHDRAMDEAGSGSGLGTGRALDRFVNFTDAVVAIAITLLFLPLLNITLTTEQENVWQVLGANTGAIIACLMAFAIVANNWRIHNRIVNHLRAYDLPLFWLNMAWLATIALMPWAASLYGNAPGWVAGGEGFGGTGLFFFGILSLITVLGAVMGAYILRHADLVDPRADASWADRSRMGLRRAVAYALAFLVVGVVTVLWPILGAYLPLLLFPLGGIVARFPRAQSSDRS